MQFGLREKGRRYGEIGNLQERFLNKRSEGGWGGNWKRPLGGGSLGDFLKKETS